MKSNVLLFVSICSMISIVFTSDLGAEIYDHFDGSEINPDLWYTDNNASGLLYQAGSFLIAESPPYSSSGCIDSKIILYGDFEVILPWSSSVVDPYSWHHFSLNISDAFNPNYINEAFIWIHHDLASPTVEEPYVEPYVAIASCIVVDGTQVDDDFLSFSVSSVSGLFKIARVGSTISVFYDIGSDWVLLTTAPNAFTCPVIFSIYAQTGDIGWSYVESDFISVKKSPPQLFVVIPGINDNGAKMIEVARALSDSTGPAFTIAEVASPGDDEVRDLIVTMSQEAQMNGTDLIINIDMDLEGFTVHYVIPKEVTGWKRSTKWAGHKANIVSEAFRQAVPKGRRILFAHSAGGDATYQSLRDSHRTKMYDDINILNGRTGAKGLSRVLQSCGYQGMEMKIFTSQGDYPSNPPNILGGSISNKDASAKFARAGSWIHLHCNWVLVDGEKMAPGHSGLRNYYTYPAQFEVYTETMNGRLYEDHTFIDAMSADWSSITLESIVTQTDYNVDQSGPKTLDTQSHLLPDGHSAHVMDNLLSQEEMKIPQDEALQAVSERVDATSDEMPGEQEAIALMLFEAGEIINELGTESFNNEESAFELSYAINDVFTMLDEGMYFEVLVILEGDILERMDGCVNTGEPDEEDWITNIESQALLYPLVKETIELLESLL